MLCRPGRAAPWQSPTKSIANERLACQSPKAGHVRRALDSLRKSFSTESDHSRVPAPRPSASQAGKLSVGSPGSKAAFQLCPGSPLRSSMPILHPCEGAVKPAGHSSSPPRSPLKVVHAHRALNSRAKGLGKCLSSHFGCAS
jgi:hypothetical protein